MIDDQSPAGSWARTLHDTRKDIRFLSDRELRNPFILEQIAVWRGCDEETAKRIWEEEIIRRDA